MRQHLMFVALGALVGCAGQPPAEAAPAPAPELTEPTAAAPTPAEKPAAPAAAAPTGMPRTVVDIAVGSPDHTTLVAALKAADLVEALASPGGVYTVFAPNNAAFAKLPPGTVEGLLKPEKIPTLKSILQHHAMVPILQIKDLKDGQVLGMADGTKVTVHLKDGKVMINDATILGSVSAANGIVHVIDTVLLPTAG